MTTRTVTSLIRSRFGGALAVALAAVVSSTGVAIFGLQAFNLTTMQDFLPLGAEGFLAIGGLVVRVGDQNLRSIERYDSEGALMQAWQLTGYPAVKAVFDEHTLGRMLIWNEDTIDGIQLVEVDGLGVNGVPPLEGG